MLIGAHVRAGGKLVPALERGDEIGAEVVQVFTQSPRAWKPTQYATEVLAGYRAAQGRHPRVVATFCHATYLINLATADRELLARSRACLLANLTVARGMGASGLVLHIGSHRGLGFEGCVPQVVDALTDVLASAAGSVAGEPADGERVDGEPATDELPVHGEPTVHSEPVHREPAACPILLENAAGAGGTMGRSFEELAEVLDRAGAGDGLGVCLDTQHLWASGVGFATLGEADAMMAAFDGTIGLDRLRCLHLNDSKVPFGANRDRHENIGDGTIGEAGLGALLGHPALQGLPAMLEVPGAGDGPRAEDVTAARRILDLGLALRQ